MAKRFDRRVIKESVLDIVRECQQRLPCHLGGGVALSGAHLSHRMTGDVDLFCHDANAHRELVRTLATAASEKDAAVEVVRDAGHLVRAHLATADSEIEVDMVYEPIDDLDPPEEVEGVLLESMSDLRAAKLTCVLSRSEPRDLVDLLFLDRAGFPPEADLDLAVQKDSGIDPGVLAWLLADFPTAPLPEMLVPLDEKSLRRFRDALATRMRSRATDGL